MPINSSKNTARVPSRTPHSTFETRVPSNKHRQQLTINFIVGATERGAALLSPRPPAMAALLDTLAAWRGSAPRPPSERSQVRATRAHPNTSPRRRAPQHLQHGPHEQPCTLHKHGYCTNPTDDTSLATLHYLLLLLLACALPRLASWTMHGW